MDLIFQWGIDAFPFRKKDGYDLTQKWKWFWDVTKRVNLGIQVNQHSIKYLYTNTIVLNCGPQTTNVADIADFEVSTTVSASFSHILPQ
jgi:predicted P-loop ATPase/GTPase